MDDKEIKYKYALQHIFDNLTRVEFARAMKVLPARIGKCKNTLLGYARLTIDCKKDIPYQVALILEDFFELPPRGLCNMQVSCAHDGPVINTERSDTISIEKSSVVGFEKSNR